MEKNYILPFLWMKGESQEIIAEEIEKIWECGIRAICLESRPHPDFMGDSWWKDVAFILEQAKKLDMKVWILDDAHFPTGYANGLVKSKYPNRRKRYLRYNVTNVWGKQGEVTFNVGRMIKPLVNFTELDKPRDVEEQAKNKLMSVVAYPLREENKLDETGAIDLTDQVRGNYVTYRFPRGNYRVFVVYETCTDGGKKDYINMMDKESVSTLIEAVYEPHYARFAEEFGTTIAGFFSDEPEIGNADGFSSDVQIGNSRMPLPWSGALKDKMEAIYGKAIREKLAYLWAETLQMEECPQIRHDFMEAVTCLYKENFSDQLGEWCREHKVLYIGHVVEDGNLHQRLGNGTGHYFRAMNGQHMAGIDVIGDQVKIGDRGYTRTGVFERDGAFFHYALAKLGASAGHLDPKKQGRTMCELFGASGWQTGVRDMKYILDHLLARGINYLVPHAFSMADYPDPDCPPHFYARGNNPQFAYFAKLMKYANSMCDMLNGGVHAAAIALLYPAEMEWSGRAMTADKPARELQEYQLEFDFVSADMLGDIKAFGGWAEEKAFYINGQRFEVLVVPEGEYITAPAYEFIKKNPQIPVIFINNRPAGVAGGGPECGESAQEMEQALSHGKVVKLTDLGEYLREQELQDVRLLELFPEMVYYHYRKDGDIHVFHNESAFDSFHGFVRIPVKKVAVYYDPMEDRCYKMAVTEQDGVKQVELELRPYGLGVILDMNGEGLLEYETLTKKLDACKTHMALGGAWNYSMATAKEYPEFSEPEIMDTLQPVSNIIPEFSGHICYEKEIEAAEISGRCYLEFTEAYEVVELWINGEAVGTAQYPPYVFELTGRLRHGINQIRAVVTSTLDRDQANYPEPFIIMDHSVSEPAGLCGDVVLHF